MSAWTGGCHCGAVGFRMESDLADPFRCNCSFCVRRGAVLQKVPGDRFEVTRGEDRLSRYGERDFSKHFFCGTCGIHCFTRITRPGEDSVAVSLACLEGVDPEAVVPRLFDGARLL